MSENKPHELISTVRRRNNACIYYTYNACLITWQETKIENNLPLYETSHVGFDQKCMWKKPHLGDERKES